MQQRDRHGPLPAGVGARDRPIEPADTVRIATNDFMFGGGDGYTALAGGTNVLQPGDALLDVEIEYIGELAGGAGGGRADREGLS